MKKESQLTAFPFRYPRMPSSLLAQHWERKDIRLSSPLWGYLKCPQSFFLEAYKSPFLTRA